MDSYKILLEVLEFLKEILPTVLFLWISFYLILLVFRIFKSLTGPFGRFDSFAGFLGSESNESENKEEIHISESSDYKINLSKDKGSE